MCVDAEHLRTTLTQSQGTHEMYQVESYVIGLTIYILLEYRCAFFMGRTHKSVRTKKMKFYPDSKLKWLTEKNIQEYSEIHKEASKVPSQFTKLPFRLFHKLR